MMINGNFTFRFADEEVLLMRVLHVNKNYTTTHLNIRDALRCVHWLWNIVDKRWAGKRQKKRESKIERRKQKMKRNEKNTLRQYVCGHIWWRIFSSIFSFVRLGCGKLQCGGQCEHRKPLRKSPNATIASKIEILRTRSPVRSTV